MPERRLAPRGRARRWTRAVAPWTIAGAVCGQLLACATTSEPHTVQAALGRVTEVAAPTGTDTGPRVRGGVGIGVGSGGTVGGVSLGLVFGGDRGSELPVVVVTEADGHRRLVRTDAEVRVGDCVALMTSAGRAAQATWQAGEATLVPAEGCR